LASMPEQSGGRRQYVSMDPNWTPVQTPQQAVTTPQTPTEPGQPFPAKDYAIGAAKGVGGAGFDVVKLLTGALGGGGNPEVINRILSLDRPEWMQPDNPDQADAAFLGDAATMAIPGAGVAKAGRVAQRAASGLQRIAVPGLRNARNAEAALSRGAGVVSQRSAGKLDALAKNPRSTLRPVADAMRTAADKGPGWRFGDMAAMLAATQHPGAGATIGALSAVTRPLPLSMISQGLYSGARAANPAIGGAASNITAAALRALLEKEEK
jgi:hypothetical protein